MAVNRTLIFEIVGTAAIVILSGILGTVYLDLQQGKKERLENKGAIVEGHKVGEGEIRRSSDVDDTQKEMIDENKVMIKNMKHDIKEMYREIGEVKRDVHHAHTNQDHNR